MLKLFRRITYFLQQRRVDRELAQEVELHRVLSAERLEHDGLDAEGRAGTLESHFV
jgi:hypothetical protein